MAKVTMVRRSLPGVIDACCASPRWTSRTLTSLPVLVVAGIGLLAAAGISSGMLRFSQAGSCRLIVLGVGARLGA